MTHLSKLVTAQPTLISVDNRWTVKIIYWYFLIKQNTMLTTGHVSWKQTQMLVKLDDFSFWNSAVSFLIKGINIFRFNASVQLFPQTQCKSPWARHYFCDKLWLQVLDSLGHMYSIRFLLHTSTKFDYFIQGSPARCLFSFNETCTGEQFRIRRSSLKCSGAEATDVNGRTKRIIINFP